MDAKCKLIGWITVFAWQATVTSATSLVATQIQGLIVLNNPSYEHQTWHGTLLMWVVIALTLGLNIFGISVAGICHILFFFALLIPLVYLAPQSSASFVFTKLKIMADGHKTAFRGASDY